MAALFLFHFSLCISEWFKYCAAYTDFYLCFKFRNPAIMRRILAVAAVLTTLTTHAQPPSYVPTNGLVGWWPFNGNANDESGNGNNGTVNGATLTQDRFGNANAAYDFGGDDWIEISYNPIFEFGPNSFTISCWGNKVGSNPFQHLITRLFVNQYPDVTYSFFLRYQNSGIAMNTASNQFGGNGGLTSNTQQGLGNWNHIVAVYNSQTQTMEIYKNGIIIATGASTSNPQAYPSSGNIYIGAEHPTANLPSGPQFLVGKIDDTGIWNRALTPAEIQALYNAQPLTPCVSPDPVSFTGLGSSYTLADAPVTLVGSPAGGVFLGPGVTGSTFDPAAAGVGVHSIQYVYVDGNDCVNAAGQCTDVTVNAGVGGSNMTTGGVRVFPNPNRGQFTVELELTGLVGMQVFDARGALVHNEVFTAPGSRTQRTLDLSTLAKGGYTLLLEHDGQRISQTVVVE